MLISFTVSNFKSFAGEATLVLTAHKSEKTLRSALIKSSASGYDKHDLLPAAAIYGANAAGKTNLLYALQYLTQAVRSSQLKWEAGAGTGIDAHVCSPDNPSVFEIEFIEEGIRYRYGIEATARFFQKEWLYSYPKGRERQLFVRTTTRSDGAFVTTADFGKSLTGDLRDHQSSTRRTREDSLLISALAQDNQTDARNVFEWFCHCHYQPESNLGVYRDFTTRLASEHAIIARMLPPLLRIADKDVVGIEIVKRDAEVSMNFPEHMNADQRKFFIENAKNEVLFTTRSSGELYAIPYEKQSKGMKRLYNMASNIITALRFGHVVLVDELEGSMHPHVASQLLALFQNESSNPHGAQLIFTTHETRLLNLQHLRRDQIWFVEKEDGQSALFPLLDFAVRKDENLESGYLRGRYGAVPIAAVDPDWIEAVRAAYEDVPDEPVADAAAEKSVH